MIPSRRLYRWLLLGTGASLLLALLGSESPVGLGLAVGLALVWDGLLLGLALLDWQRVQPDRLTITRQLSPRLSINRQNQVTLTVHSGDRPVTLQIRDGYPLPLPATAAVLRLALPANRVEAVSYSVLPTERGEYGWGPIQVRQLGAWGLAWRDWQIPQPQTVAVYPDLVGLRALSLRLTLQAAGALRQSRRLGLGTEFAELRDYAPGDDPRLIDWNATARRDRLLLRVLEPEREQTLMILLDRGRLMTAQIQGLTRFDWGLNAALSLALAGLHRGDRVGVGLFDRQLHCWLPPMRGQAQLSRLIERLTPIQPVLQEPDYLGAVTFLAQQQTRRALVVLITELVDRTASAELLTAMLHLRPRHLPFCVALRDPGVDLQAQQPTQDIASTYERAVALDLIGQRQVAFAVLKQKGVLVLDAPAHQISQQLVDRYLQLKARSQL